MLDWEDGVVMGALAFPGIRLRLRGAIVRAAMPGPVHFNPNAGVPFGDVGAAIERRLMENALRRAALLGDALALAAPQNAPPEWPAAIWAETADIDCANAPPPRENSFAPLENHMQKWHRCLKIRAAQSGAAVCASPATLTARLNAHLQQADAHALAGLHPEGRMSGWWLGFCRGSHAETVYSDGDEAFYSRLPGAIQQLGAKSLRLLGAVNTGLSGAALAGQGGETRQIPILHGRVINAEKLLHALPAEAEGCAALYIEDEIFTKNHGLWQIEGRPTGVTAAKIQTGASQNASRVTAGSLAAFLLGDTMAPQGSREDCLVLARMFPPINSCVWACAI